METTETIVEPERPFHTADMVRALNDAEPRHWPRYECVYGELVVSPSPGNWHQIIAGRLLFALMRYVEAQRLDAMAMMAPADISWGRTDVTVQPDVYVVPRGMMRESARARAWSLITHLMLACEVISPSSRHSDRFKKRILYQRQRVPVYWIVDHEQRHAEVWTPDAELPAIERERLAWHPEGADEPLVIELAELFAEP
jgi:Uma2 family endonuclease